MAIQFTPGQTLSQGDLEIFLVDVGGFPADPFSISYAIYFVDPLGPEVLIGPPDRVPVHPQLGEYYASLVVPPSAVAGSYRIRWTFTQISGGPVMTVVQDWTVVNPGTLAVVYSQNTQGMINKLRMLLRDQCVGGEETVEVDADGERMVVSLEELHNLLNTTG